MNRIYLLLFLLSFLFSCATTEENEMNEKKADLYYQQGTSELIAGEYTEALTHLLKADELRPNDSLIENNLGMAYYLKKQDAIAEKFFSKAIKHNEANSDARTNLASLYYEQGKLEAAEKEYKTVLQDLIYQGQYRVYYNLGLISQKRGRNIEAGKFFAKSVELKEDYCPGHLQLGQIAESNFDFQKALKHYTNATLGVCVSQPEAHFKQVDMLVKLQKYKDAKKKIADMLQLLSDERSQNKCQVYLKELERLDGGARGTNNF